MLLCHFLENTKYFSIEKSLVKIMNTYNKTVHKVTKFTSFEVFCNSNNEFYKIIYNNTLEHHNKNRKTNPLFNNNEKYSLTFYLLDKTFRCSFF